MMAALTGSAQARSPRIKSFPASSARFDWLFTLCSLWMVGGLVLDGWAHAHGQVDNSFFTPWHAVFYSGFGAVALFMGVHQWRSVSRGHLWRRSLPAGYELSLVGAAVFAVGGAGDMVWHTLFGIERDLAEALLSPTHLTLATGMLLIVSGPLRSAWARWREGEALSLAAAGPLLLAAGQALAVLMFFTGFAHPFLDIMANERSSYMTQNLGVAGFVIQSALIMSVALTLVKRWRLPFGALTLVITLSTAAVTVFQDYYFLIPAALAAGLIADLLVRVLRPCVDRPGRFYLFAFLTPLALFVFYFLALHLAGQRVFWSVHLWTGSIFMAGAVGLLISFLLLSPFRTAEAEDRDD